VFVPYTPGASVFTRTVYTIAQNMTLLHAVFHG